jgi:hypothetical protein
MAILSERLLTQLLHISSVYNFRRNIFSTIVMKHLSNKNFLGDSIIEGKKLKRGKREYLV